MPIKNDVVPVYREVRFPSGTDSCAAWFFPAEAADRPVILMAHGLGAIKALRLDAFATRFQTAGYACLVFDYRHFGESSGEPRELLSIRRQREDWRAAVAFARTLPDIDPTRVVLWGTSFAGGHVIATAAEDRQLAAAVVQCPFTDGLASAMQISPSSTIRLTVAAIKDTAARLLGRSPVRVKVAARSGEIGLMDAHDVIDGVLQLLHASGIREEDFANDVPARVALEIPFARPGRKTKDINVPILFCVCDKDTVAPPGPTLRYASKAPRGEVKRYPVGHFDIYTGKEFDQVTDDQLAFLATHVPVTASQ